MYLECPANKEHDTFVVHNALPVVNDYGDVEYYVCADTSEGSIEFYCSDCGTQAEEYEDPIEPVIMNSADEENFQTCGKCLKDFDVGELFLSVEYVYLCNDCLNDLEEV